MTTELRQWWDEFRSRTDQQEQHIRFFKEHGKPLQLDNVHTMVSVGAGCGELDSSTIKDCMPQLVSYIGVEPDDDNRETLSSCLKEQCPHIQVTLTSEPVPEWSGPKEPVDLVLAVQVFWYFKDPVVAIEEMWQWVKPGGSLIIGHSCDDFIFARLIEQFAYTNGEKEYYMDELRADLQKVGLNDFDEFHVPVRLRTIEPDEQMLTLIINADPSALDAKGMEICLEKAKQLCKVHQPYAHFTNAFIRIRKPEII